MTTAHTRPTDDLAELVHTFAHRVNRAGPRTSLNVDRDTAQALVGGYQLAATCLNDVTVMLAELRRRLDGPGRAELDACLSDHGIETEAT